MMAGETSGSARTRLAPGRTGYPNLWRPKTVANTHAFRPHCPLGAHHSRHIRDAAGLRVGIGPVASRLALSWPDLPEQVAGPNEGGNFSLSLMVERQRCRFRLSVHHLPVHPPHVCDATG
jgi:hypothetical protein